MAFGSDAWDRLFGPPRPAELHTFREIRAGSRHAVSTPGDLLFHIRARADGSVLRVGDADNDPARCRRVAGRRSARLSLFRRPRSPRLCRRHGEPHGPSHRSMQRSSATRTRRSPAAAMSSCRNTCTIWPAWNALSTEDTGAYHRPHQALRYRAGRRDQAKLRPQRADRDRGGRAARSRSCATTCPSARRRRASSALISSATAGHRAPSSRCSRTCSSAVRPAITTGCSTSAAR